MWMGRPVLTRSVAKMRRKSCGVKRAPANELGRQDGAGRDARRPPFKKPGLGRGAAGPYTWIGPQAVFADRRYARA